MTKDEFKAKFKTLVDEVPRRLNEYAHSALCSGGIDLEAHGDNYELARIVISAALQKVASDLSPLSPQNLVEVDKLKELI